MAVSERIGRHLRSNVVAYVALFAALGGTAVALPGRNNVKSKNLAANAVKSRAIASGAVKNADLATGAVSSTKLAAGAVVANTLGANAVTTDKIADSAVARAKIAQGSINGGKLANGSVDSAKVNNGSLLAEDFAAGQISDGFVLSANGNFSIARAGPIFVVATFVPTCAAPPCTYTVQVAGAAVPGATFTVTGAAPGQLTLIGITAPISAGTNSIALDTGTGTASSVRLGGILLQ